MPNNSGTTGSPGDVPYAPTIEEQFALDGKHPLVRGWYWDDMFWHSICLLPVLKKRKIKMASLPLKNRAHAWYSSGGSLAGPSHRELLRQIGRRGSWMQANGHTPPVRVADSMDFESERRVPISTGHCGWCTHGGSSCDCWQKDGICILTLM